MRGLPSLAALNAQRARLERDNPHLPRNLVSKMTFPDLSNLSLEERVEYHQGMAGKASDYARTAPSAALKQHALAQATAHREAAQDLQALLSPLSDDAREYRDALDRERAAHADTASRLDRLEAAARQIIRHRDHGLGAPAKYDAFDDWACDVLESAM